MDLKTILASMNKYMKENSNLSYTVITDEYVRDPENVKALVMRIGPLSVNVGLEYLASKIAEKYNLRFEEYDVSRGEDEPASYVPMFATTCYREDEIEEKVRNLLKAEQHLRKSLMRLADILLEEE